MPVTADEPDLMLALDHLAKASGVKVLGLSPGAPTAEVGYVVLPVQLSLDGSYASLFWWFTVGQPSRRSGIHPGRRADSLGGRPGGSSRCPAYEASSIANQRPTQRPSAM